MAAKALTDKSMAGLGKVGSVNDQAGAESAGLTERGALDGGAERASMESALAGAELPRTIKAITRPRRHTNTRILSEPGIRTFPQHNSKEL